MQKKLLHIPFFPFLLATFFVMHGFVQNIRFIRWVDCLPLLGLYLPGTALCFLIFRLLLHDNGKAAVITSFITGFYLFFGAVHTFLRDHLPILSKYIILLPLFFIVASALFVWLKRRAPFVRAIRLLNILLLAYLMVDIVMIWPGASRPSHNIPTPGTAPAFQVCNGCPRPDIYFLLFDEYTGSRTLQETYHYNNSSLDSFLIQNGFHIQPDSRSNYEVTPFSMASVFNATYLDLRAPLKLVNNDYLEIMASMRSAAVLDFLTAQGYKIINNSPFDLPGHPATMQQSYFTTGTHLITRSTLFNSLLHDLGWRWSGKGSLAWLSSDHEDHTGTIRQALSRTLEYSRTTDPQPRFIYTHLFMPHGPFLFDSLGQLRPEKALSGDTGAAGLPAYLGYLPYTNARVRELISGIRKNTSGNAVIIFISDHGYRYSPFENHQPSPIFSNQNAIFYPDGDYRLLYDSLSSVNEFRVIFNKLFQQHVPLLKDSVILLRDDNGPNKKNIPVF